MSARGEVGRIDSGSAWSDDLSGVECGEWREVGRIDRGSAWSDDPTSRPGRGA